MPRRLRILMLNNEFPPLGGGTGVVNQHLLTEWAKRDEVEVDLITSSPSRDGYEFRTITPHIRLHHVPVNRFNIHHAGNRELLTYAWRSVRFAQQRLRVPSYDLCVAFATVPAGGAAYLLWKLYRLPYVVRVSGPDIPGFENRYRWLYPALTPVVRRFWAGARTVIAKCEDERQQCQAVSPGLPVAIIPNAVDSDVFRPTYSTSSPDRPLRILSVGRLIERKGQHHLIEATRLLQDMGQTGFEVLLAGTGDGQATLVAQVERAGLGSSVRFLGFVPHEEMPGVYAEADLFVLPSYNEGMSVALLEAMATGLPVIVTPTGGTDELLDGNGLIVSWGDIDGLAGALAQLLSLPEKRAAMGRRSRELALRRTWPATAQEYLDLCLTAARAGAD